MTRQPTEDELARAVEAQERESEGLRYDLAWALWWTAKTQERICWLAARRLLAGRCP